MACGMSASHARTAVRVLSVFPDALQKKWLAAYNADKKLPEDWLAPFMTLYERVKGAKSASHPRVPPFPARQEHDDATEVLNDIRNQFIHLLPVEWAIHIPYLVKHYARVLDVVEFLVRESGSIRWDEEARRDSGATPRNYGERSGFNEGGFGATRSGSITARGLRGRPNGHQEGDRPRQERW